MKIVHGVDSDAAWKAASRGRPTALRYLRKYQRVSLGVVHEMFPLPGLSLRREDTKKNTRDALTKGLDGQTHGVHTAGMGLVRG